MKDFDVPRSGFEANSALANLLANESHLNDEEKSIKCAIQDLIKQLEQLQGSVNLKRDEMELANCNHFIEIRRQIDIQREELKAKIDEIALKLIAQVRERKCIQPQNKANNIRHSRIRHSSNESNIGI